MHNAVQKSLTAATELPAQSPRTSKEASHPSGQYLWRNDLGFFLQKQGREEKQKGSKYNSGKDPWFTTSKTIKRKQLDFKN